MLKAFTTKNGLREGDGLSPLLFNVVLDCIMKILKKENTHKNKLRVKL